MPTTFVSYIYFTIFILLATKHIKKIDGEADEDCDDYVCGPSTKDFSFSVDGFQVNATRKSWTERYRLRFDLTDSSNDIFCSNDDANTNWCQIVGIQQ